jgi:protein gp37
MASKIEWTDESWNPITGCTKISEGCKNCDAERMAKRLAGRFGYPKDEPFKVTMHHDRLHVPSSWKKPRRIFVNSMGDTFHPEVEWNWLFSIFQMAGELPRHTFMFLTKRPRRMSHELRGDLGTHLQRQAWCTEWPLPNVWLGASIENNDYHSRIEWLLDAPAAKRFVSCEPLLSPIDLTKYLNQGAGSNGEKGSVRGEKYECQAETRRRACDKGNVGQTPNDTDRNGKALQCIPSNHQRNLPQKNLETPSLNWVILGGGSGPGARPMHPDWVRAVRDQCQEAGVPFFFKQWGEWIPGDQGLDVYGKLAKDWKPSKGNFHKWDFSLGSFRIGKKAAGRMLDGQVWDQTP